MCGAVLGPGTKSVNDGVKRKESAIVQYDSNDDEWLGVRACFRCQFDTDRTGRNRAPLFANCHPYFSALPVRSSSLLRPQASLPARRALHCESRALPSQAQRRCRRALGGRPRPPWRPHEAGSTGLLSCTLPLKLSWARPRSGVISNFRDIIEGSLRDWQQIMKIDGQQKPLRKFLGPKPHFNASRNARAPGGG